MSYTKEEIVNGLIACSDDINGCTKCPFHDCGCFPELRDAIIELLESHGEPPEIDPETLPIVKELRAKLLECDPKHGHWIKFSRCDKCSCCGYETSRSEYGGNYCKMCGAKMCEEL